MLGIAMLTIVRSSSVMKKPSDTTTRTAHGFPRSLVMPPTLAHQHRGNKIYLDPNGSGLPPRSRHTARPGGRGVVPRSPAGPRRRPDPRPVCSRHGAQRDFGGHFPRRAPARPGDRAGARGAGGPPRPPPPPPP